MEMNKSSVPRFEFDEQRTYFQATLHAHPEHGALSALRALGNHEEGLYRRESA